MSAILSHDDLNDFISPGVTCVKPIEILPPPPQSNELEISFNHQPSPVSPLPPAQISLTDCLACSGCVTSAEAILVSLQSHDEVLKELDAGPALRLRSSTDGASTEIENPESGGRIYVASVSPQTRASIAATFGVNEKEAGYMIEQLLSGPQGVKNRAVYRNGFHWVLDTNVAREICLVLGAAEVLDFAEMEQRNVASDVVKQPTKPILTSSCPGWICYAEKTHPHILPHLSKLKSPQAVLGTLLKTVISQRLRISPDRIWHVAVMPCFDKKLEASREELTDMAWNTTGTKGIRDVDSVITSKELLMLADSRKVDFENLPRAPIATRHRFPDSKLDSFLFPPRNRRSYSVRESGTSGGNLYYILRSLAVQHPGATIQTVRGRNADVLEYIVESPEGDMLLKAARYYGFRNIQNLVRRLKPLKTSRMPSGKPVGSARRLGGKTTGPEYAYVEVMACPGGCTNGGGQIKLDDPVNTGRYLNQAKPGSQEHKEWLAQVDEAYFSDDVADRESDTRSDEILIDGISPAYIKDTLAHWAAITGIDLGRLVYTTYREVISDVGKNANDTQKVIEMAGKIGGGW